MASARSLRRSKPLIWRQVVVRADLKLDRLHGVIQIAMGWKNCHLHQFIGGSGFRRTYYLTPNPEFGDMGGEMLDEKDFTVAELAPAAKRRFSYEYDFGDSWEHEVLVEKILPPDSAFKHPVCLAGANACPPEDCGGLPGYENLLAALADPKHPEHNDMKEWIGGGFDLTEFDVAATSAALKRLKA